MLDIASGIDPEASGLFDPDILGRVPKAQSEGDARIYNSFNLHLTQITILFIL